MKTQSAALSNPEQTLLFLHIPKTAGTSFTTLLSNVFGAKYYHVGLNDDEGAYHLHKRIDLNKLRGFPIAGGHLDFSICRRSSFFVPFTVLRNPTDRVVSSYYYIKNSDHASNVYFRTKIEKNAWSLLDFARDPDVMRFYGEGQIRQLAGYLWQDDPGNLHISDLLSIAKHNLSRFKFIGMTELFPESVKLFLQLMGVSEIKNIPYENKGKNTDPIAPEIIQSIEEITQPEHEFYHYARQKFEQQYAETFAHVNAAPSTPVEIKAPEIVNVEIWDAAKFNTGIEDYVLHIPAMLSYSERLYIHWHMNNIFTGQGEAVELGSFLGGSTSAALSGLSKNLNQAASKHILKVYDFFEWTAADANIYKTNFDKNAQIEVGQSFQPMFYKHIAPWSDRAEIFPGDICNRSWNGGEIEYLFVDLMKSPSIATHVAKEFFPHLVPGLSWVLHQDYKHYYTFWIHLIMYRLRNYLTPAYSVKDGPTVAFRCIQKISIEVAVTACELESFSIREIKAAFQYSQKILEGDNSYLKFEARGAHLRTYMHFISEQIGSKDIEQIVSNIGGFDQRLYEVFPMLDQTRK